MHPPARPDGATGDGTMNEATAKRRQFRELLARDELLVMPGGFSPLLARIAQDAGFESYFIAGSQLCAFLYGYPDTGVMGLRDVVDHARHVAARTDIPIFLDFDTGFGNAVNVWFAVQEAVRAGVAGLQIEDQEAPKKSGTSAGRRCIPVDEAVGKYRAAVAARDEIDREFVVCARCDALGAAGETFESALNRCIAYAEQGGVDLVWLNSVQSREQLKIACREIPVPVLTIWGGQGPAPTLEEYRDLGLRVVLYPTIAASSGMQAAWRVLHDFRRRGQAALADWAAQVNACPDGPADYKTLSGIPKVMELERRFLAADSRPDYEGTWGHGGTLEQSGRQPPK
ncbi:MAG: isocitrate lyase/PEP mutase family protein [Alcaligenaceae bacterium]|nr:isocitrate lyase/PEP mutase family protein [Alcaligenaceae bacterium SAGV5]MPS51955.1 isocitrate lyase/PEP mutase family protein [Alcaligenaceae bacterium SAGV3]MPT58398.1 isocitrate lyase/PEP mutase family protein [Alcaligenaceae bacterium]